MMQTERVWRATWRNVVFLVMTMVLTNAFWPTEGIEKPLRIQVLPESCTEACRVVVRAAARPNAANEQIILIWGDSLLPGNTEEKAFAGNQAEMSLFVEEGQYTVAAVLYRKDSGVVWREEAHVSVVPQPPQGSRAADDDAEKK